MMRVGFLDQPMALDCDQLWIAGAGSDESRPSVSCVFLSPSSYSPGVQDAEVIAPFGISSASFVRTTSSSAVHNFVPRMNWPNPFSSRSRDISLGLVLLSG